MSHPITLKKRAYGRSLRDFKSLTWAEKKLIASTSRGKVCLLGSKTPDAPTRANAVRPELIRFLALGGDDYAAVHEKGVQLAGAYIGGTKQGDGPRALDLDGCELSARLGLWNCRFAAPLYLEGAKGRSISLNNSIFPGIQGDGLHLDGDLFLGAVRSSGKVRLLGAGIGGDLSCEGGQFEDKEGPALACDRAIIGGGVFLGNGFRATGGVRLLGASIGGDLSCLGGRFKNSGGAALSCDGVEVAGSVFLNRNFHATGAVRLLCASIGNDLTCIGGRFESPDGFALFCDGSNIGGALLFRGGAQAEGVISLTHAKAATLADDVDCWPEDSLDLDGFRYDRIDASAALDAKRRIAWLDKQIPQVRDGDWFALQPWMQLAKVLREQGHFRDAAEVDIAREDRLRAAGKVADRSTVRAWRDRWGRLDGQGRYISFFSLIGRLGDFVTWALHWFYGWFSGYGHRPMRIVYAAFTIWIALAFVYRLAASDALFAPLNAATVREMKSKCDKQFTPGRIQWTQCDVLLTAYPRFSPYAYSLDLILPVARLGQSNMWTPISDGAWFSLSGWTQRLVWFEEIFGWVAALTLGAIAAGLVKRRDG
ncbi:hypothetical protein [Methylocystis parvus]|uniref:hypothetical protein n=1 Tax=Methylocystis parvus TaxID=134 RepID=UPI003C7172F7